MDKYEYKLRSEEIRALIKKREFKKAVDIADTIDWTRVRSVSTLCTISDLYKINRRYPEAKAILRQAYERNPGSRSIVRSLCEICIKTDDIVSAIEYYKEFVQLAPMDIEKFILQYKIYEAQEVSLEERIAVLEELKKREYIEKWGYELAYLYHRIGLSTKCVEECDELILWFREGKYVKKAMELKMLHQQLTGDQQSLYQMMLPPKEQDEFNRQTRVYSAEESAAEVKEREQDIQVKTMDVSKYNTINLQKELAESMKQVLVADQGFAPLVDDNANAEGADNTEEEDVSKPGAVTQAIMATMMEPEEEEEQEPQETTQVTGETAPMKELFVEQPEEVEEVVEKSAPIIEPEPEKEEDELPDAVREAIREEIGEQLQAKASAIVEEKNVSVERLKDIPDLSHVEPPASMGRMLSQEYDGQISMVVPESERIEKQITGQMNLEDVLAEWEKTKKNYEEKRKNEVKQRFLDQTGSMFTEFEAKVRDGYLEKLENGTLDVNDIEVPTEKEPVVEPEEMTGISDTDEVEELEEITETPVEAQNEEEPESEDLVTQETDQEDVSEVEEIEEIDETEPEEEPAEEEPKHIRQMSEEEVALFAPFIQTKGARVRLMQSLDQISLAAYTGNVFVTGDSEEEAMELAKNVIRDVQLTDGNFSGKIAKVNASALNHRDVTATVEKLANGGLIIQKASLLEAQTVKELLKALNQEKTGIVVVLQDNKKAMHKMMEYFDGMKNIFNVHIEVEELGDDALVAYGKKYAQHLEYSIDELGVLALHTRIDELQTSDHVVTVADVRDIVDEAIEHANKKNMKHLMDILLAKRYDDEDMIILREKDFLD